MYGFEGLAALADLPVDVSGFPVLAGFEPSVFL